MSGDVQAHYEVAMKDKPVKRVSKRNDNVDPRDDTGRRSDKVDQVMPGEHWNFDEEVTAAFDDMLSRSIPQYEVMRQAVTGVASRYVQPKTAIVDLGISRGEAIAALLDHYGDQNLFVGVEISEPMLETCRHRFKAWIRDGVVDIRRMDLRLDYPEVMASATLSVLTLQFVPLEYRQRLVAQVYEHTVSGGAFVLVEKVLGCSAEIDSLMVDQYYQLKSEHGYTQEQIERKRLSLEGILVPVTAAWNEELLRMAGFRQVDCFWRWMNFAAWVAVKD